MTRHTQNTDISAIVVVGKRQDDLKKLGQDYLDAISNLGRSFELIFVLDGNYKQARTDLENLLQQNAAVKIVQLSKSFGEASALKSGFDQSRGGVIITLPAYYQVSPDEFRMLYEAATDQDLILARREPRRGNWFEKTRRNLFHGLLKAITGYKFSDLGCSVRVMKRRVLDELSLYGDQHRFLPVLAINSGFSVKEMAARQSEYDEYRERYRLREYLHRALDIFTIFFLVRFTRKPLRFFGMIGSSVFAVGALILAILITERLFFDVALADRPAMLLSSLLVVLGLQLFSLGLIGELIIFTHARSMKEYKIDEIIGGKNGALESEGQETSATPR